MIGRLLLVILLLAPLAARADSSSTSYLDIDAHGATIDVQWSLALRDLDDAIGLDTDGDGRITWGELRSASGKVAAFAVSRLRLSSNGAVCPAGDAEILADRLGGAGYAVLRWTATCAAAITTLDVGYSALFESDPRHRGLARVAINGADHAAVFSPANPSAHFASSAGRTSVMRDFFQAGIAHLVGGSDHLLFIAMLLAPALLRTDPALGSLRRMAGAIRVLTAFTLAHGVTLALAVLHVIEVSPAIADPAIAMTILVTAADNLLPFLKVRRDVLALGFGVIHGLSVAGTLGPLGLPPGLLAVALVSFNLGIEATQIAIACAFVPLAFCIRATQAASHRVLPAVSAAALVIAALWLAARLEPLAQSARSWQPGSQATLQTQSRG